MQTLKQKSSAKTIKGQSSFSRRQLFYFVLIFALIGSYFLIKSLAAPLPDSQTPSVQKTGSDINDLNQLLSDYGQSNSPADLNKDGNVNLADLSRLLSQYGQ